MSAYLALVAISVLAGFGLLTRLRLPVSPIHRWYLAPGATMLVWAIALGVGVSLGLTLRTLSGPVLALTLVVAILGALDARRAWAAAKPTGLLILAAMPLAVMALDVAAGLSHYIGGSAQDGWSYVAYGQYLWEWPKGTEGGLAPLHQYAAHLNGARFIASAMLGLFSPLTGAGGDTQAAAGAFVAWTLFVFGSSCAASADGLGIRRGWLVLFTATAVISPWVHTAVLIHNYDNLLALSFLPVRDERRGCGRTAGHASNGVARCRTGRDPLHLPGDEPVRRLRPRAGGRVPGDAGPPVAGVGQDLPAGWRARRAPAVSRPT